MKKVLLLLLLLVFSFACAQEGKKDTSKVNFKELVISPAEEYKLISNFPTESNVEMTYEMSKIYKDYGDEFFAKGLVDSAQVYYAKSAFTRDPSMILLLSPEIKVIDYDAQAFEDFRNNNDSTEAFINNTKSFLNLMTGRDHFGENIDSFPKAVIAVENVAYRNNKVNMEIISELSDKIEVDIVRWGKEDYLPWTQVYPDTTLSVSRARYLLRYSVNGKDRTIDIRCSSGCRYVIR